MEPLATPEDVEARLGRVLTGEESARVDALLRDASATIREFTGQTLSFAADQTYELYADGTILVLPELPAVVDETHPMTVRVDGVEVTDYERRRSHLYRRQGWGRVAEVTYSHGYETIPDAIVTVTCWIVIRALGSYSYRNQDGPQSGATSLLPSERYTLQRYRRSTRTIGL